MGCVFRGGQRGVVYSGVQLNSEIWDLQYCLSRLVLTLEDYLLFSETSPQLQRSDLTCRRAALGGQAFELVRDDVTGFWSRSVWHGRV